MLNLFRKVLIFGAVLLAVAFFNSAASACSCYPAGTVDKELAKTPNVAVLKLQSIQQNDNEPARAFLSVEKIFKGELKTGEVLTFEYRNCEFFFSRDEVGDEFLLYLGDRPAKNEFWRASGCSRSGAVKDRKNDLNYLENEAKFRNKTRLSGKLVKWVETLEEMVEHSPFPLANRKIRIVGNGKTAYATTDESGAYEIYDLSPGKYRIYPGKLDGFAFQQEKTGFKEVEIKAKSQTELDIFYSIANAISGKVVDRDNKPIGEICVALYSLKMEKTLGGFHKVCTEEDGKFEISAIPEGVYKIVVNGEDPFDLAGPNPLFGTFYYPNVETLEKAAEIAVSANYFLRNLILVPPVAPELLTLTGRVIYADGKPAADRTVQFLSGAEITDASPIVLSDFEARTDRNGQFSLRILKGKAGILRASFFTIPGEYKDCPQLDEITAKSGASIQQIKTQQIEVSGKENLNAIELKFPFPYCEEKDK